MITKVGYYATSLLTSGLGGLRGADLSAAEEAALKQHYGLDEDASLGLRNAGRGLAGGMLGGMLGKAVGGMAGSDIRKGQKVYEKALAKGLPKIDAATSPTAVSAFTKAPGKAGAALRAGASLLPLIGKGIGTLGGAYIASNKYSKDNAQRIMNANKPVAVVPVPQPNYWG